MDLLSAALDESGLNEEFLQSTAEDVQVQAEPLSPTVPAININEQFSSPKLNIACSTPLVQVQTASGLPVTVVNAPHRVVRITSNAQATGQHVIPTTLRTPEGITKTVKVISVPNTCSAITDLVKNAGIMNSSSVHTPGTRKIVPTVQSSIAKTSQEVQKVVIRGAPTSYQLPVRRLLKTMTASRLDPLSSSSQPVIAGRNQGTPVAGRGLVNASATLGKPLAVSNIRMASATAPVQSTFLKQTVSQARPGHSVTVKANVVGPNGIRPVVHTIPAVSDGRSCSNAVHVNAEQFSTPSVSMPKVMSRTLASLPQVVGHSTASSNHPSTVVSSFAVPSSVSKPPETLPQSSVTRPVIPVVNCKPPSFVEPSAAIKTKVTSSDLSINDLLTSSHRASKTLKATLSSRDLTRLWNYHDDFKEAGNLSPLAIKSEVEEDPEVEEEEEELGHAETYANYMPSKSKIGIKHPDPVVETSSLASIQPPDVWYQLQIPEEVMDSGNLSALQLEAIVYACQKHETFLADGQRAGFLIGDGAGVGKGRELAGIIYENYLMGRRRALWLSVSNDLKYDAERDLKDIGAGKIAVHPLNKFKYAKISSKVNGSVKKGVVFATYSSLIGESQSNDKYRTRLKQLLHWCGSDFDGVIVFDECHKAKNLCPVGSQKPTKTGLTVLELQNQLPKARIVYASATGASEPKNMAYMTRLGIWGPQTAFREFSDFIQAVEKRGVGAMEIVAMDMKMRGMYIARQLSFSGVTFKIEEISLTQDFVNTYDASVKLWVKARAYFQQAIEFMDPEQRLRKTMWGQFWSAHQRFFKYLCIAAKVKRAVQISREAVKNGKCTVIGLQSTGEARTLDVLEEYGELNDFVSTAKGVFQVLVEKHFPAPSKRPSSVYGILGLSELAKEVEAELFSDSGIAANKTKRKLVVSNDRSPRKKRKLDDIVNKDDENDVSINDSTDSINIVSSSASSSDSESSSEAEESDFNPFGRESDSDDDPWLARKKKSTKDKIKERIEKKKEKNKKQKYKLNTVKERLKDEDRKSASAPASPGLSGVNGGYEPSAPCLTGQLAGLSPAAAREQVMDMRQELLDDLETLDSRLPPNTLDELIDLLGGPDNVAEMTGRKGRIVSDEDGTVRYESRSEQDVPLETLNLTEKQRFMDNDKQIAIISEAASSGISLQSDKRAMNQRRRVHVTLELPWSADRAVQQFGRTHRSNQVNAPEYIFLISELAGECRFASVVAKRLESLGALTHGDRRATESRDLSRFNFDNRFGRAALEAVMRSIAGLDSPVTAPPADYPGKFFDDAQEGLIGVGLLYIDERFPGVINLDKDYNQMSKFLNRILGIKVDLQNALFQYFSSTLKAVILQAKRNGRYDIGIMDLGAGGDHVKHLQVRTFMGKFTDGTAPTELHTVSVERGLSWEAALDIWREHTGSDDGFYISIRERNNRYTAMLSVGLTGRLRRYNEKKERMHIIYRPNTGKQLRAEPITEIKKMYRKVLPDEAQETWQHQYIASANICSHAFWRGNCRRSSFGLSCDIGLRCRTYHILSGSVLSVWQKVERVLSSIPGSHNAKMQIIRVQTSDKRKIAGILVPKDAVKPLINVLSDDAAHTFTDKF